MKKKRIASIDYGLKRIGMAISDESQTIASSLGVIESGKSQEQTIRKLLDVLEPYALEKIVVGYPIHLNGAVSVFAKEVEHFVSLLENQMACSVILLDERLSTRQAQRSLKECGLNRKKRSKVVDAISAVILLQSYLGY